MTHKITWSWGNWTFGFWVRHQPHTYYHWVWMGGVDLGPLEWVWRRRISHRGRRYYRRNSRG